LDTDVSICSLSIEAREMKNMDKISAWRSQLDYATLILMLILFEFIVSVIMLLVGYLTGNAYFRGVGIGLIISWVTSALAYFIVKKAKATFSRAQQQKTN